MAIRAVWADTTHWELRAKEARTIAESLRDTEIRRLMMDIADGYEAMAEHAKRRHAELTQRDVRNDFKMDRSKPKR